MTFAKGMTLKSATSDLVIASQKNIAMDGVSLSASQDAAIRGMRGGIACQRRNRGRLHGHDQGGTQLERRWIDLQSLRIKHTYGGHYHQAEQRLTFRSTRQSASTASRARSTESILTSAALFPPPSRSEGSTSSRMFHPAAIGSTPVKPSTNTDRT